MEEARRLEQAGVARREADDGGDAPHGKDSAAPDGGRKRGIGRRIAEDGDARQVGDGDALHGDGDDDGRRDARGHHALDVPAEQREYDNEERGEERHK